MDERLGTLGSEQLKAALRREGLLANGSVRGLVVEREQTTVLSRIAWLRAEYVGEAQGAPERFVLKTGHPERFATGWDGARQEITFYKEIAAAAAGRFAPRCFDSAADPETKAWHLLLEDLSETHQVPGAWPLPLPLAECERRRSAGMSRSSTASPRPHAGMMMRRCGAIRTACRSRSRPLPTG